MEELLNFFVNYGLWFGVIALAGVILLSVLKYCKVFEKITNDNYRKVTYLLCSVGFSLIGCIIYMLCTSTFNWIGLFPLAAAIWALNQTFYNIFKTTKLNDLVVMVMNWIVNFIKTKMSKQEEEDEE